MMPTWLIYHFASGTAYFTGAVMLGLAALLSFIGRRPVRVLAQIVGAAGVIFVVLSATPSPLWLYAIWGATVLAWLIIGTTARGRRSTLGIAARLSMLAACAGAAVGEARYHVVPSLPSASCNSLYVLGDSISAGIGSSEERAWPQILADRYGITVVNLARAGATAPDAVEYAAGVEARRAVVLIEIGGNDLLSGVPVEEYERALRRLFARLSGSEHALVMCELPLPPFCSGYGKAQRKLAVEFGITLVPKRMFASVLSASGATIDDLHLSESGHERMAEMIWNVVGRGFRSE